MNLRAFLQSLFTLAALSITVSGTGRLAAADGGEAQHYELRVYTTMAKGRRACL
jgi:hypothetical protein